MEEEKVLGHDLGTEKDDDFLGCYLPNGVIFVFGDVGKKSLYRLLEAPGLSPSRDVQGTSSVEDPLTRHHGDSQTPVLLETGTLPGFHFFE